MFPYELVFFSQHHEAMLHSYSASLENVPSVKSLFWVGSLENATTVGVFSSPWQSARQEVKGVGRSPGSPRVCC